jgi:GNAT superfamily N-acetyltransferase
LEQNPTFIIRVAIPEDKKYALFITDEMASSALARGTGIARRSPEYVQQKMDEGKAVIALTETGEWVGFCYIEAWGHDQFVANSGLIVSPAFRGHGVATAIKNRIFELSREKYPHAKIFGLTTGLAVMKINSELGYKPVTYSELTDDDQFWKGCQSCVNYEILMSRGRINCFCTAMLYDPTEHSPAAVSSVSSNGQPTAAGPKSLQGTAAAEPRQFAGNFKLFERWLRYKKFVMLKAFHKKEEPPVQGPGGEQTNRRKFFFNLF